MSKLTERLIIKVQSLELLLAEPQCPGTKENKEQKT